MTIQSTAKPRIALVNNTIVERIVPELAVAIGLNESIMLLQIDFWLGQVPDSNFKDGKWWTFQSTRDMQKKAFPYWGVGTVSRTITSLKEKGYIFTGNYNKRKSDTTQWFALNVEKLQELFKEIPTLHIVDVFQNGTGAFQSGTAPFQNGTTLPETTPETTTIDKKEKEPSASFDAKPDLTILDKPERKKKDVDPTFKEMQEALRLVFNWEQPTGKEWAMLGKAAKELLQGDVTVFQVASLYRFCKAQWKTKLRPYHLSGNVSEWRKSNPVEFVPIAPPKAPPDKPTESPPKPDLEVKAEYEKLVAFYTNGGKDVSASA